MWEWVGGSSNCKEVNPSLHKSSEGSLEWDHNKTEMELQAWQHHYPQPESKYEDFMQLMQFHRTIDSNPSVILEAICQINMIDPWSIIDMPMLDPCKCPVPSLIHVNALVPEVPGLAMWEQVGGLSNNEVTNPSHHKSSEGSLEQDHNEVKMELQYQQHQYPQPASEHEEFMQLMWFHRTIDSPPSVILEVIHQHHQKWKDTSQSDSELGVHMDNLMYDSSPNCIYYK